MEIKSHRHIGFPELLRLWVFDGTLSYREVLFKKGSLRGSWAVRKTRQRKSHPVAPVEAHLAHSHLHRHDLCKKLGTLMAVNLRLL